MESIEITPLLNGQPGQVITHDPTQKQRVLWIPESESGQLRIEAAGKSCKVDACKLAHASAEIMFTPEFTKPIKVELQFATANSPGTPTPTLPSTPSQSADVGSGFEVGSFNADYYNGTRLVASETVARPAINYAYSDFNGIPSQDFRGVWTGTLNVARPNTAVDINADYGWADGKLFIDEVAVPFAPRMRQVLSAGKHSVRVELDNNWHTTDFNLSFTSNAILTKAEAKAKISSGLSADTKIVSVDSYESRDRYNTVTVKLEATKTPVFLVLASHHAISWVIDNPENVAIKGVAYGASAPGPTVTVPFTVPTYQVQGLDYQQTDEAGITGRGADVSKSEYSMSSVVIVAADGGSGGGFEVGSFNADYYNGTALVASETVVRPAINYAYSDFNGIPSQDFRGVWMGALNVAQPRTVVDINADYGWADGKLFIDEVAVPFAPRMRQVLSAGKHSVRVELDNNWHTTDFNLSFTSNAILTKAEAKAKISSGLSADTKIVSVDSYESRDRYNTVTVKLEATKTPVFLVLASHHAISWVIDNPKNVVIKGVAYGALAPGPTVTVPAGVPTYQVQGMGYQQTYAAEITGRGVDVSQSEYSMSLVAIVVP